MSLYDPDELEALESALILMTNHDISARISPIEAAQHRLSEASQLALLGMADSQLAQWWNIDMQTLLDWKLACPEFLQVIEQGRKRSDPQSSQALYRSAIGYSQQEFRLIKTGNGQTKTVAVERHVIPDVQACMYWLKYRCPEQWGCHHECVPTEG